MGLILDAQKSAKRQALLDSAYDLFLSQGTEKTSISDIVTRAGVAKGTFYLYFHDKQDILRALTARISHQVMSDALNFLDKHLSPNPTDNVIAFVDYIVEFFKREPFVLRVIERNFSWPSLEKDIRSGADKLYARLQQDLCNIPSLQNRPTEDIFRLLFSLVTLVGSMCYSSIIENRPAPIDDMKPVIYDIIRKSLN